MSALKQGILIVVEGIDGAGKTTQCRLLAARLAALGFDVVVSKEPTSGPWGQELRESATRGRLDLERELQLFINDRQEHVAGVVAPALESGAIVILDRYYFSTAAYQGARGADMNRIFSLNAFAPRPDLLVLLDVSAHVGLARISGRGDANNLFEQEENLTRARELFNLMEEPTLLRLDGELDIDVITGDILKAVVSGVLYERLCLRGPRPEICELSMCGRWVDESCPWPSVARASGCYRSRQPAEILSIAQDSTMSIVERAAAIHDRLLQN